MADKSGRILTGMGGWIFEPWRGVFYPPKLPQSRELDYASRHVGAIEINSTYYSSQKPATFARWAAEAPDGFVFSLKASRFCTNRKVLAEAGPSIERFFAQGIDALGDKLGPILWQFMGTKKFDPDDFAGFLGLLPRTVAGVPVRHCLEVRHASFATADFVQLCRAHGVAICVSESPEWPLIADPTADFVYARLMQGRDDIETGYGAEDLAAWARRLQSWAAGNAPADLPALAPAAARRSGRDVFAFFISAGKVRAPAAAMALAELLRAREPESRPDA